MLIATAAVAGVIIGALAHYFWAQRSLLELELLREKLSLQEKYQQEASAALELKLREISRDIIEEKTRSFREDSLRGMELVLNPFRERMASFQQKVEEIHQTETRDRVRLQTEIERIIITGQKMSQETENLTRALKGDVKVQGNWGEVILEKILEASGLRSGEEFTVQGKDLKLTDEDGNRQLPDVVINLPEGKHLVIDSKVSLTAYERYTAEASESDLCHFLDSLYAHVKGLSAKKYQSLERLQSPDYVMLFIPIEGAFMLAMQKDRELLTYAWQKNIVLVGPSTLLATLRTVSSLWKQERQSKNALEIARQAGALYDKFVGVAQDLDQIDAQLARVGEAMGGLRGKMLTGRGSLASRMEALRELGAKNTKTLMKDLNESA